MLAKAAAGIVGAVFGVGPGTIPGTIPAHEPNASSASAANGAANGAESAGGSPEDPDRPTKKARRSSGRASLRPTDEDYVDISSVKSLGAGRKRKTPVKKYEVETVVERRQAEDGSGFEFLVKWKGYPSEENTWEPQCNLSSAKVAIKALEERQLEGPGKRNKILTDSAKSGPGTEAMDEEVAVDTASAQLPSDAAGKPSNDAAGVALLRARKTRQDWTEGEKEQLVGLVRENGPGSWDDKALQLGTGEPPTFVASFASFASVVPVSPISPCVSGR